MKAYYEHTPYLHDRKILLLYPTFRCITHKKVSKPAKEIPDKETTIDPIRCLAVTDETDPLLLQPHVKRGGRNRIGRREKWPKKSWEEGEIGGKSREEGEKET